MRQKRALWCKRKVSDGWDACLGVLRSMSVARAELTREVVRCAEQQGEGTELAELGRTRSLLHDVDDKE